MWAVRNYNKALLHDIAISLCRGLLARQGASLEIALFRGVPVSLWPSRASGVQIPLPAPPN